MWLRLRESTKGSGIVTSFFARIGAGPLVGMLGVEASSYSDAIVDELSRRMWVFGAGPPSLGREELDATVVQLSGFSSSEGEVESARLLCLQPWSNSSRLRVSVHSSLYFHLRFLGVDPVGTSSLMPVSLMANEAVSIALSCGIEEFSYWAELCPCSEIWKICSIQNPTNPGQGIGDLLRT